MTHHVQGLAELRHEIEILKDDSVNHTERLERIERKLGDIELFLRNETTKHKTAQEQNHSLKVVVAHFTKEFERQKYALEQMHGSLIRFMNTRFDYVNVDDRNEEKQRKLSQLHSEYLDRLGKSGSRGEYTELEHRVDSERGDDDYDEEGGYARQIRQNGRDIDEKFQFEERADQIPLDNFDQDLVEDEMTVFYRCQRRDFDGAYDLVVKYPSSIKLRNAGDSDKTLLHYAAECGQLNLCEFLVRNGAEVDAADKNERTPLIYAVGEGHRRVAEFLMNSGANVNHAGSLGETPLHRACKEGHVIVAELLIERGAKLNKRDIFGRTPLYYASSNKHQDVVNLLISTRSNDIIPEE